MNTKKKLLLLEDDVVLRSQIEKVLSGLPLEITCVGDGMAGLDLLKKEPFHIVLSDIRMPIMDGIKFATQARADGYVGPIILISGSADKEMAIQAIKFGALDFIEKPFRSKDLLDSIERALKKENDTTHSKLEELGLSQLHITILDMIFKGCTNKEIALEVNLSEQGVKYHIGNLLEKFTVENRTDLRDKVRLLIKGDAPKT